MATDGNGGSGEKGWRVRRERSGDENEDDAPLMNESIDFFDFDWVPDRERMPPDKDEDVTEP